MAHMPSRLVLAALVATVVVTGCSSASDVGGGATGGRAAANATTAPLLPTQVSALPSFDVDAYRQLLGQLRGTPVVVNVWASWCGPCEQEAPALADAATRYGAKVQFLGIDILDTRGDARGFIDDHRVPYPSVYDASGAIRDWLGVVGQPATLFYSRGGELVQTWAGEIAPDTLDQAIRRIAA
jgi:cytochrome c biogenesis protein CcmG/thiol:disulfide interchange protein DsbE